MLTRNTIIYFALKNHAEKLENFWGPKINETNEYFCISFLQMTEKCHWKFNGYKKKILKQKMIVYETN